MILIADSGSTKTDWALVNDEGSVFLFHTQGINPIHQDVPTMRSILTGELLPQLPSASAIGHVFFYGSGVRPTEEAIMQRVLSETLYTGAVHAHSDLLGAARALCGHGEGVACILGTGANSCLFDGERIVMNTPPMGYILGDEGSGAVLGVTLLNALYKGLLPPDMLEEFESQQHLSLTDVIDRVYRQPMANRFLASLSPFVHAHIHVPAMRQLVVDHFHRFFVHNLAPYGRRDLPVSAVGSVAFYYKEQLREAAESECYTLGHIERSPIHALVDYHR